MILYSPMEIYSPCPRIKTYLAPKAVAINAQQFSMAKLRAVGSNPVGRGIFFVKEIFSNSQGIDSLPAYYIYDANKNLIVFVFQGYLKNGLKNLHNYFTVAFVYGEFSFLIENFSIRILCNARKNAIES